MGKLQLFRAFVLVVSLSLFSGFYVESQAADSVLAKAKQLVGSCLSALSTDPKKRLVKDFEKRLDETRIAHAAPLSAFIKKDMEYLAQAFSHEDSREKKQAIDQYIDKGPVKTRHFLTVVASWAMSMYLGFEVTPEIASSGLRSFLAVASVVPTLYFADLIGGGHS